jgi:hypothetical protein
MAEQLELYPSGLTRAQFASLSQYADRAKGLNPQELLQDTQHHLERAKAAHSRNRLVNVRLATAIHDTIAEVVDRWDTLPHSARSWLAGACLYFSKDEDEEPDFGSPIGCVDDAEVLNTCLRFAQLADLCLYPEDYDDV